MASKELEKISTQHEITLPPTKEKKKSLKGKILTALMVPTPMVATIFVGATIHPVLGVILAPISLFASVLYSGHALFSAKKELHENTNNTLAKLNNQYDRKHLMFPLPTSRETSKRWKQESFVSSSLKKMVESFSSSSNNNVHSSGGSMGWFSQSVEPITLGKLLKSFFKKQNVLHIVESDNLATITVYKYRFMQLTEVEEHNFVSAELEWERGFSLCAVVDDSSEVGGIAQ